MEFQRVVKTPTVYCIAVSALKAKRGFVWGLFLFVFLWGGFFYITGMDKTEEIKKPSLSANVFYICVMLNF